MSIFLFTAKTADGRSVKGEVDAPNEAEARVKLRAQKLIPTKIQAKSAAGKKSGINVGGSIPSKDLQIFTRQFATLVNSGIPIVQGINMLADGTKNLTLKASLQAIRDDIAKGKRLAEAMLGFPKIFNHMYCNLVRAGEEGGVLDTILNRLATYIEKAENIKQKVKGALFYPVAILFVAALVIAIIMLKVVPKFEELFKSTGRELPALTQTVIDMSHFIGDYWYLIIASVFGFITLFKFYYSTKEGKLVIDQIMLKIPIFGALVQKSEIAKFSRTLSTLLASGVSLMDALEIASQTVSNQVISDTLQACRHDISEGKSIVSPLAKNKYIPDMVVQMIGVGEQTGALDVMLDKIAVFYEEEVDYAVTAVTSMIEPLMMVFLGGSIAFLVVALYLPIFDLAGSV